MAYEDTMEILNRLYESCGKINDFKIINQLVDLGINGKSEKEKVEYAIKIIAKQCALNFFKFKGIVLSRFNTIFSNEELLKYNTIDLIINELCKFLNLKKIKYSINTIKGIRNMLLDNLVNRVSNSIMKNYFYSGKICIDSDISEIDVLNRIDKATIEKITEQYIYQTSNNPNLSIQEKDRIIIDGVPESVILEIRAKIWGVYDYLKEKYQYQQHRMEWNDYLKDSLETILGNLLNEGEEQSIEEYEI